MSEQRRVKMKILVIVFLKYGCVGLPANAVVHGQPARDFPGVLKVEGAVELAAVVAVQRALVPGGHAPQQEIRL